MTTAFPATLRRTYSLHGVAVDVLATEPAAIDAMDLRLLDFRSDTADGPRVRFTFAALRNPQDGPTGPVASGRPVYETPYGTLYYRDETDTLTGELGGVALDCDGVSGTATISAPTYRGRDLYFATHPLASVALIELMERRDRFSLHAGCLSTPAGDGVLLSGPSGAGKSTLALALAATGLDFLGDDTAFLRHTDSGVIEALGFADTVGVGAFAAAHLAAIRPYGAQAPEDGFPKRLHRIEELFGRPAATRCVPRLIVFPEVTPERPSELRPLDPGEALLRLVPDVLLTDPRSTQAHLGAIAALLEQVRCVSLQSGHDLEAAAEMVAAEISG